MLIWGVVISSLIILVIAGYAAYKIFIVPKMVEPALEKVAEVMQDDEYTSAITKEIRRLYEAGQVSGKDIEQYLEKHDANVSDYIPGAVYKGGSDTSSDSNTPSSDRTAASQKQNDSSSNKSNDTSTNKSNDTSTSSLGVSSVNIRDENTSAGSGSRYSENNTSNEYNLDSSSSTQKKTNSSDSIYERAKAVMTPSDYSTAMAIGSKIDVGKAKSLMNDKDALMSYIQSTLTPDEYSTGLSLYAKYANAILE